jgi:hypothetical protein
MILIQPGVLTILLGIVGALGVLLGAVAARGEVRAQLARYDRDLEALERRLHALDVHGERVDARVAQLATDVLVLRVDGRAPHPPVAPHG